MYYCVYLVYIKTPKRISFLIIKGTQFCLCETATRKEQNTIARAKKSPVTSIFVNTQENTSSKWKELQKSHGLLTRNLNFLPVARLALNCLEVLGTGVINIITNFLYIIKCTSILRKKESTSYGLESRKLGFTSCPFLLLFILEENYHMPSNFSTCVINYVQGLVVVAPKNRSTRWGLQLIVACYLPQTPH